MLSQQIEERDGGRSNPAVTVGRSLWKDEQAVGSGGPAAKQRRSLVSTAIYTLVLICLLGAGLVPRRDVVFVILASLYAYTMAIWASPPVKSNTVYRTKTLKLYVLFAAVVGLFLPLGLIVSSLAMGDQSAALAAGPHFFLLCAQILSEDLSSRAQVSAPIQTLVPILYNSRRLITLWSWTEIVFGKGTIDSTPWLIFEQVVVVSNLLFWNFNLWAFLLPVYLPWAFRKHFEAEQAAPKVRHQD